MEIIVKNATLNVVKYPTIKTEVAQNKTFKNCYMERNGTLQYVATGLAVVGYDVEGLNMLEVTGFGSNYNKILGSFYSGKPTVNSTTFEDANGVEGLEAELVPVVGTIPGETSTLYEGINVKVPSGAKYLFVSVGINSYDTAKVYSITEI